MDAPVKTIPLIKADLPAFADVEAQFREILANGRITNFGPYVRQFEADIEGYVGAPAVCVSSATAGLILTLGAMELPAGSRVALPSFSFVATAQAVVYAGLLPTFVEVGPDGTMDPEDLAAVLEQHQDVVAVIPVHMYGIPCRTAEINAVVQRAAAQAGHAIPVIYDAAHAFGSAVGGRRIGTFGDAEVFSTSVTKVLTSVEGGIITSRNPALLERLRKMRNYGIERNYNAFYPGLNGKMSEFHAIVGIQNLRRMDALMAARMSKAQTYAGHVRRAASSVVVVAPPSTVCTYKDFTVCVPSALATVRDDIIADLAVRGIETRPYFHPPIHEMRFFRRFADRSLPWTEDFSRRVITLPFSSTITDAEMVAAADALGAAERLCAPSAMEGARA